MRPVPVARPTAARPPPESIRIAGAASSHTAAVPASASTGSVPASTLATSPAPWIGAGAMSSGTPWMRPVCGAATNRAITALHPDRLTPARGCRAATRFRAGRAICRTVAGVLSSMG